MRLLQGTKVGEAPAGWREALVASRRSVVVDVGAGDGRFVYESARRDAERFYVAIDPDATALGEYAFRAARKPARGRPAPPRPLPDGAFEFVLSYDPTQDAGAFAGERLPAPDEPSIDQRLVPAYA